MKLIYSFIFSLFTIASLNAQCNDFVNIPNSNFKNALLNHGNTITSNNITTIDTDGDGEICITEAEAYTGAIKIKDIAIDDLTGLEAFKNITALNCENIGIETIDISNNTSITFFNCSNNQLTSLDVSKNIALKGLFCFNNNLSSLDISKNTNLKNLRSYSNNLSSLNTSNNPNLNLISTGNNNISSIDLSANPLLTYININENELTSIDVTKNINLETLCFVSNNVSTLSFAPNSAIQRIGAENNQLTSLDVSTLPNLNNVKVENNQLTSLNIANGNNAALPIFSATGNPDLTCITIDVNHTPTDWTKDATASYSDKCLIVTNYISYASGKDGVLQWTTTNEEGQVMHFNIYRSTSSNPTFTKIAEVSSKFVLNITARNTSNLDYTYTDASIGDNNTDVTYQIEEVDTNGDTQIQRTVSLEFSLPVTISSFNITPKNNDAVLSWSTSQEINNRHFNIQRSFDGQNFETIGEVDGHGNTSTEQEYSYTDFNVGQSYSTVYYRLQQVDFDGNSETFDAKAVTFENSNSFTIFPNPSVAGQTVTINGNNVKSIDIYNTLGKKLHSINNDNTLDISNYATGVYFVVINGKHTQKLIVK